MESVDQKNEVVVWRLPITAWVMVVVAVLLFGFVFHETLLFLLKNWERDEYGYGYFIPAVTAFLIWQQKNKLEQMSFDGTWYGVILLLLGLCLFTVGSLGAVDDIAAYGMVIVIFGLFLSFTGIRSFKHIFIALVLLWFMIPLPAFIYAGLSGELQLISSRLGVALIRLFGISVYLEGNVIDLGIYKIQVIEACNGLRYLFPLLTLGFIAAYFFKVELWKRVLLFLSTIPITVLMNSIRIGAVGITVEYWGVKMADDVLHDFEGWVIFLGCMILLFAEMMVLAKMGNKQRTLQKVFGIEFPNPTPKTAVRKSRSIPGQFIVAFIVLVFTAVSVFAMPERIDDIPERKMFSVFPDSFGEWKSRRDRLESIYIDALRFDDYMISNYFNKDEDFSINLYAGYYNIQRAGKVPHSPKVCIPGGGWQISDLTQHKLDGIKLSGIPLTVNRLLIERGDNKQLVYYWFQQRNRVVTNEYLVKWYLLVDAITRKRTDGALVRFTVMLKPGLDLEKVEKRLQQFVSMVAPVLPEYIPK